MRYKITIPKHGKNVGVVTVEGMEQNENCQSQLMEVAVGFGPIIKNEPKDHFDDDNPVHDTVSLS